MKLDRHLVFSMDVNQNHPSIQGQALAGRRVLRVKGDTEAVSSEKRGSVRQILTVCGESTLRSNNRPWTHGTEMYPFRRAWRWRRNRLSLGRKSAKRPDTRQSQGCPGEPLAPSSSTGKQPRSAIHGSESIAIVTEGLDQVGPQANLLILASRRTAGISKERPVSRRAGRCRGL